MIEAPIFHVNGEDPEAVVFVGELALDFRQRFGRDVVIDMVCYRRHGHNEGDEPAFTQPLMYEKIKNRISIRELYTEQLVMAGDSDQQRGRDDRRDVRRQVAGSARGSQATGLSSPPPTTAGSPARGRGWARTTRTSRSKRALPHETLLEITREDRPGPRPVSRSIPSWPRSSRPASRRWRPRERSTGRSPRCWRSARCSGENIPVRLSGQDSRRGTFSQRHSVLIDQKTGESFTPLNHLTRGPARVLRLRQPALRGGRAGLRLRLLAR